MRLNMAVPATPRNSPDFSSLGIVQAAVLGLTDPRYNGQATNIDTIPNMDGFPNGRRFEDDVTTIELQAVSGVALAAIGLWYDDYPGTGSPVTADLVNVLTFNAGVTVNDTSFKSCISFCAKSMDKFQRSFLFSSGCHRLAPTGLKNAWCRFGNNYRGQQLS